MARPTVFVVDDDPGVRRSLAALFRSHDLPVETYASAGEFQAAAWIFKTYSARAKVPCRSSR